MTRYCVNATVELDAWVYVEADTPEDAVDEAETRPVSDFETGEPVGVSVGYAEEDE